MAYITVQSGYCTGENPGSGQNNNGGLRMYWELRCYTSTENPTIGEKSYSCPVGSYRLYYKLQGWYGVTTGSNYYLMSPRGSDPGGYVRFRNGDSVLWEMIGQSTSYTDGCPKFGSNDPANTWYDVREAVWSNRYVYPEGLISVSEGTTLSLNLSYNIHIRYNATYNKTVIKTSSSTSVSVWGGRFAVSTSVTPGCSAWFTKNGTVVQDGSYVFLGDTLVYHYSVQTGYEITQHTVNGATREDGYTFTLPVDPGNTLVALASCVVQSFALNLSSTAGISISVTRASSPKQNAALGALQDGDTIYYSDTLNIAFVTAIGYDLITHTVNDLVVDTESTTVVTGAVAVVGSAALKTFLLSLNIDSGSVISVQRTYSPIGNAALGQLSDGDTLYYSDVIEIATSAKPGYVFQGATLNGEQISSPYSVTQNVTIVVITIAAGGYIGAATAFDLYQFLIRSQQSWDLYRIVIKSSQGWDTY